MEFLSIVANRVSRLSDQISDNRMMCIFYQVHNKNSQNRPWLIGIYHMKLYQNGGW